VVGRTGPLPRDTRPVLGALLRPAGQRHPWPAVLPPARFGDAAPVEYTRVEPTLAVELDQAAQFLRHHAIQSQYAGLQRQEVAFGLAAILDELSRHLPDLNDGVRWQTVQACRQMLAADVPSNG
jgi:hypothetical protein